MFIISKYVVAESESVGRRNVVCTYIFNMKNMTNVVFSVFSPFFLLFLGANKNYHNIVTDKHLDT